MIENNLVQDLRVAFSRGDVVSENIPKKEQDIKEAINYLIENGEVQLIQPKKYNIGYYVSSKKDINDSINIQEVLYIIKDQIKEIFLNLFVKKESIIEKK